MDQSADVCPETEPYRCLGQIEEKRQDLRLNPVDAFDSNDMRTDVRAARLRQIPDKARDRKGGAEVLSLPRRRVSVAGVPSRTDPDGCFSAAEIELQAVRSLKGIAGSEWRRSWSECFLNAVRMQL